jgi:hypothetical protein
VNIGHLCGGISHGTPSALANTMSCCLRDMIIFTSIAANTMAVPNMRSKEKEATGGECAGTLFCRERLFSRILVGDDSSPSVSPECCFPGVDPLFDPLSSLMGRKVAGAACSGETRETTLPARFP